MVILVFIIYAIHHYFIAGFVASTARWASSTLANYGYEHAAYYAGLGWVNSDVFYWALFFEEVALFAIFVRSGQKKMAAESA